MRFRLLCSHGLRLASTPLSPQPTINSDPNKCKVFIGGLESSIDTPDLKKFFSAYGNVKDSIVCMDKHLRTSRGFGFITFATEEEVRSETRGRRKKRRSFSASEKRRGAKRTVLHEQLLLCDSLCSSPSL